MGPGATASRRGSTPTELGHCPLVATGGQMVVVDQLVDRTWGRADTFHDTGGPTGEPGTAGPVPESQWFRTMGWHVVNMTGYPEAVLAAELGVRYAGLALVTDYDAGVDGHAPVTMDDVFAMMRANVARVRTVIVDAVTVGVPSSDPDS